MEDENLAGETILCAQRMVSPAPLSKKVILAITGCHGIKLCASAARVFFFNNLQCKFYAGMIDKE